MEARRRRDQAAADAITNVEIEAAEKAKFDALPIWRQVRHHPFGLVSLSFM